MSSLPVFRKIILAEFYIATKFSFVYNLLMIEIIKTFIIGIFIGIANVIPGVSGGTLIVVFNVYDKFVDAITLNIKKLVKNRKFIIPFLLGMASGILIFSKAICFLYEKIPVQTNLFFSGLILGSIPLLVKYTFKNKQPVQSEKKSGILKLVFQIVCIILGFVLIIAFSGTSPQMQAATKESQILPALTVPLAIRLFFGGFIAAIAMIIPGISGSLTMLIFGIYKTVIIAISALSDKATFLPACAILIPAGIGIVSGLLFGAKLIRMLLDKIPHYTYAVILGLIAGSVLILMPASFKFTFFSVTTGILSIAAGFCLAYFSTKFSGAESKE